jgi:Flp pilus assembly protein TadD
MRNLEGATHFRWSRVLTLEKLGSLQLLAGRSPEARRTLEILLSEEPSNATALNGLAYLCMLSGELETALEYASRAVEEDPLNPELQDNLRLIQEAISEKRARP